MSGKNLGVQDESRGRVLKVTLAGLGGVARDAFDMRGRAARER